MTLKKILEGIDPISISATVSLDSNVTSVSFDSRQVTKDGIFVAIRGEKADGHSFINKLQDAGLAAIIAEEIPAGINATEYPLILVKDTHEALGIIASNFYGNPSRQLRLVGVTGTNGKTTIATLIYEMGRRLGIKAGLLSTVANYVDDRKIAATHTTPDPLSLNKLLREMVDSGCEMAAMEVSSHAAHQKRIAGLVFTGGIFTNLTRDHLDYHQTVANYRDAKKMFFDSMGHDAFALINIDDRNGEFMVQNTKAHVYTYALNHVADFTARVIEKHINGTVMEINSTEITTQFSGIFNVYNLTAVYATMLLLGFNADETAIALSAMKPVAGRFQTMLTAKGSTVVIDYAHTPDALQNILDSINEVKIEGQKVITVVGCGGNRDKGKRPIMGRIAAVNSDVTIFTSDNPRDEDPMTIIEDITAGVMDVNGSNYLILPDREEAIRTAIDTAGNKDIILIAGKGHEDYQEIKGVKHHFNDAEIVLKYDKK